ncbi:unnamed protein product [Paramecium sonneborni]|uniref:Fumarylacetoacetase-like C-terminal domain-containing protein n=1 Tax=Paramecium sonneborni TaxID=65129 RepID=A0A8S1MQI2_9CILI|nr:unnamed protein product [Paramecium sonneborni]
MLCSVQFRTLNLKAPELLIKQFYNPFTFDIWGLDLELCFINYQLENFQKISNSISKSFQKIIFQCIDKNTESKETVDKKIKMNVLFRQVANPTNPKIVAIAKNYVKHVKEMGGDKPPEEPVIFQKPFSSLMYLPEGKGLFQLPKHNHEIHHEIELGFMVGKIGKNIQKDKWQEYIGGYFLALDLTDREMQAHFKKQGFPWDLAKGQDNFFPITELIQKEKVNDPNNLQLELKINEKVVQSDSTSSMYYKIPDLLAYISQFMTLRPGDLVLTGTPHGVGPIKVKDQLMGTLKQGDQTLASLNLLVE